MSDQLSRPYQRRGDVIAASRARKLGRLETDVPTLSAEWRHGRGGHLTLADEDLTSKMVDGWRRVNTLAHYGVKDSAVMSLVPRQGAEVSPSARSPCKSTRRDVTGVSWLNRSDGVHGSVT